MLKLLLTLLILGTLLLLLRSYTQERNLSRLLRGVVLFGVVSGLGVVGMMTRPIVPLFIAHLLVMVVAWGGLIRYLWQEKFYPIALFLPLVPVGIFILLELLTGSRHGIF